MNQLASPEHGDELLDAQKTRLLCLCVVDSVEDCEAIRTIQFPEEALGRRDGFQRGLQISGTAAEP